MSSRFVLRGNAPAGEGGEFRTVEGSRIKDKQTLLCELASALDYPDYFGRNWDAFEECLRDAADFNRPGELTLRLKDSRLVRERLPDEFETLLSIWADSAPAVAPEGLDLYLLID